MTRSHQFVQLCSLLREKQGASNSVESVASFTIEELCRWFHCEWATYWHVQPKESVLIALATWTEPGLPASKLLADTKNKRLRMNEGNAGIVWRTGKPICSDNLILEMCLPRSLEATEAGLRGGIWIPVIADARILGVIELLGRHYWSNSPAFLDELSNIGHAVGEALTQPPSP